ncbi:MAG: IclR family transcriptional regulator [Rhodospirillaceae bacterium]|nr:IclR family transcriptional regulator [Rhodospirillaceae bacterium]
MSALGNAFDIIEAVVDRQHSGLAFAEVIAATGLPKATAHRLLKELTLRGMLVFDPETRRYRGSLKLAMIGANVMGGFDLRDHAHPHLRAMQEELGHTCHLGILDGHEGVYVDKLESRDYGIKLFSAVGKRFPLHCTGMGKALIAHLGADELGAILVEPLAAHTDHTITDPEQLNAELRHVRDCGYAVDREEITRGIVCVAAPVFGSDGQVVAAMSATFPAYVSAEHGLDREIESVRRHAAAVSGDLGRHGRPLRPIAEPARKRVS